MMKKRLFSLLLAAAILCGTMPSTAFAFDEVATNGETVVNYTVSASYVINIPASINLNENPNLEITASSMNTNWGQRVSVFIDGSRTFENGGNFYLYQNKGAGDEKKIKCDVRKGSNPVNGLDAEVGRFDDGSTENTAGNGLTITPMSSNASPGTYTGIIYFRISMS